MRIVFLGTPQFAVATLAKLLEHPDFEVVAVVTQPDKRRGRGSQTLPSAVKKVALEYNLRSAQAPPFEGGDGSLPIWQPSRIKKDRETLDKLRSIDTDAFVVVAYGQILSEEILQMPRLGCINVHGSLLPQYRGAAPIQWSICNGDRETGITTMLMDRAMDTGDMLLKATTPIDLLANANDIAATLAELGADLLIETLLKFDRGEITPIPQDNEAATYARLIDKSDFAIDWSQSAIAIHNRVRGFFPNCFSQFRGSNLKVIATVPLMTELLDRLPPEYTILLEKLPQNGSPGEIVRIAKNLGALVQTGQGLLLLQQVQPAGKRIQSGWDFVNGMRIAVGEKLD
jgi:methionyl-tRNA formyltransferase